MHTHSGAKRYQPKYKANVAKFNCIVSNQGYIAFISGPHPGAMSDTTLARLYRPVLKNNDTLLGDKAYESIPNVLPPIKGENLPLNSLNLIVSQTGDRFILSSLKT